MSTYRKTYWSYEAPWLSLAGPNLYEYTCNMCKTSTHITIHTKKPYWLVVWNTFYFPIHWVSNHPNWRSYFSEGWPNHQPAYICKKISRSICPARTEKWTERPHMIHSRNPTDLIWAAFKTPVLVVDSSEIILPNIFVDIYIYIQYNIEDYK